jgi:hypothetical protein
MLALGRFNRCDGDERVAFVLGEPVWVATSGDVGVGQHPAVSVPDLTIETGSPPSCEPQPWFIRIELGEDSVFVRVWPATDPEPAEWTTMALRPPGDTSILGLVGLTIGQPGPDDAFTLEELDVTLTPST